MVVICLNLKVKITYKRGGGMIGNKGVMYGYKSGGQV